MEAHDCLGDYKRMKKLGVKFDGEPEIRPYGTGVMLEDLYGNKIFMNQEPWRSPNERPKFGFRRPTRQIPKSCVRRKKRMSRTAHDSTRHFPCVLFPVRSSLLM